MQRSEDGGCRFAFLRVLRLLDVLVSEALTLVFTRRANHGLEASQLHWPQWHQSLGRKLEDCDWETAGVMGTRELTMALVVEARVELPSSRFEGFAERLTDVGGVLNQPSANDQASEPLCQRTFLHYHTFW